MITLKIGENYEDCKQCGEVTYTSIEYVANSKVECRKCYNCGDH